MRLGPQGIPWEFAGHVAMSILISCETGGDRVPPRIAESLGDLESGWPAALEDRAAAHAAGKIATRLGATLLKNEFAPHLIDVSRSLRHRQLFPPGGPKLSRDDRRWLVEQVYQPYRAEVRQHVARQLLRDGYVIHLSVRTFEPLRNGQHRRADAGLLYDPGRAAEVDLCLDWIDEMYEALPMLKVRRNYPRRGTADSLTKAMRHEYAGMNYFGIELQLNRAWANRPIRIREEVLEGIAACFAEVVQPCRSDAA
jgi:predicted N-formylglutamate amidohydrolase